MIDVAKKKNSIYVMMIILFLTKVLGLFKLRVISHLFGATHELDIFWAAFTIPDTLFMIIVAGSLNAAIIPLLADVFKKNGERELNKFFINMMIIVSSVVLVIALLLFIFTPQITRFLMNSEFSQGILNISGRLQAEDFDLFVKLSRILMISPVLLGISTIVTGYLQVRRQFFVTSLAPLIYNIAMTIGPVILVGVFKMDVTGIAISAVLGSFLHFLFRFPH